MNIFLTANKKQMNFFADFCLFHGKNGFLGVFLPQKAENWKKSVDEARFSALIREKTNRETFSTRLKVSIWLIWIQLLLFIKNEFDWLTRFQNKGLEVAESLRNTEKNWFSRIFCRKHWSENSGIATEKRSIISKLVRSNGV